MLITNNQSNRIKFKEPNMISKLIDKFFGNIGNNNENIDSSNSASTSSAVPTPNSSTTQESLNIHIVDNSSNVINISGNDANATNANQLQTTQYDSHILNKYIENETLSNSVKNLFEKIKEVELESKNNNLSIEDMSKIHKIVHYEIDELMEKYLLIPRANRISLIIKDNKTAQNILQEQLKKIISDIQAINEEHIKKLSNNFINTKMNMNNNINQNDYIDFNEYYRSNNAMKFINSFNYVSTQELVSQHMIRILGVGKNSSQEVNLCLSEIDNNTISYLEKTIEKANNYENMSDFEKRDFLIEINQIKTTEMRINKNIQQSENIIEKVKYDALTYQQFDEFIQKTTNKEVLQAFSNIEFEYETNKNSLFMKQNILLQHIQALNSLRKNLILIFKLINNIKT